MTWGCWSDNSSFQFLVFSMSEPNLVDSDQIPAAVEENQLPAEVDEDDRQSKFAPLIENMSEHTKVKRNATFWGFYKPIDGDDKGQIMVCSVCKPNIGPSDAQRILKSSKKVKGILRYKPSAGSSGLRKHISTVHSSVCSFCLSILDSWQCLTFYFIRCCKIGKTSWTMRDMIRKRENNRLLRLQQKSHPTSKAQRSLKRPVESKISLKLI